MRILSRGAPVRYAHCPARYEMGRFERRLPERGVLRETRLGGGPVKAVRTDVCLELGIEVLKEDVHFFLAERPSYLPGQAPVA